MDEKGWYGISVSYSFVIRRKESMGEADKRMKEFLKVREIFAQLMSVGIFGEKGLIKMEQLAELDTELLSENDKQRLEERQQDVRMKYEDFLGMNLILCIEEQGKVHYYMPVRKMMYDGMCYDKQCKDLAVECIAKGVMIPYGEGLPKESTIYPVVSAVLYVGSKPWDGPRSLYDMFQLTKEQKEKLEGLIPDYPMKLIDASHLSREELDAYEGDVKAFLIMLNETYRNTDLKGIKAKHRETWYAVGAIKNDDRYRRYIDTVTDEELQEGKDLCQTLDYYEAKGEKRGIKIGESIGETRGIKIGEQRLIIKMIHTGKHSLEEIAELTGYEVEEVKKLMNGEK